MTYDNDPALVALAREQLFQTRSIPMQNTHLARMDELVISRDLNWLKPGVSGCHLRAGLARLVSQVDYCPN